MSIQERKKDHVRLCVENEQRILYEKSSGFGRFDFVHNALPECSLADISTETSLLGRRFSFPLFLSSMTGGYAGGGAVNSIIAAFCERHRLPFGVGSQRVMLEHPEETPSFEIVRKLAPTAFIAANIGGTQVAGGLSPADRNRLVESIAADAIIVHLNPLQELMQPEGDRDFTGVLAGISELAAWASVPVIVKETGAGISATVAQKLINNGVALIDVAGAGGTSWAKVENARGARQSIFDDWGIPTAECIVNIRAQHPEIPLMASGGIRSSLDIGKALCLGADFTAAAQPVIKAIDAGGDDGLEAWYEHITNEFRSLLLLLGARTPASLGRQHLRAVVS
ncbi:MAG: type 2 isopentenyl-diphosphate Delta-isomerase [Cyclonatronaceae bacterium]